MSALYRLVLDENGVEDCADFTNQADALLAFGKAKRRSSVFSARLNLFEEINREFVVTIASFERS